MHLRTEMNIFGLLDEKWVLPMRYEPQHVISNNVVFWQV